MNLRRKYLALAGAASIVLGASIAAAGTANATTFNCLFSNGCGAISGVNANGTPVAVDAKYQNPTQIAIGYPDNAGDSATNVALVAHSQRNFGTHTWADTALAGLGASGPATCTKTPPSPAVAEACTGTNDGFVATTTAGGSLSVQFNLNIPVTVPATVPSFSSNLPTGLSPLSYVNTSGQTWKSTVNLGSAAPGVYGGQSFTATYTTTTAGVTHTVTVTVTFALRVFASHQFNPAPSTTFYTIVFAKNGDWSSQCLTDVSAGKLRFEPCTLGNNAGQRFYAYANGTGSPTTVPNVSPSGKFAFKNGATGQYLEDPSISNPSVPQSNAADSVSPGGRQLDVNGVSPTSPFELWTWGS